MSEPSFNPGHHPILDLPPEEFVKKANAAGIKLAEVAFFNWDRNCGCALGVAAVLADRKKYDKCNSSRAVLRLDPTEWDGIMYGFDNDDPPSLRSTTGHAWGSAIRAAALEIQGDLEPTPLKTK